MNQDVEARLRIAVSALREIEQWGPFPNVNRRGGERVSYSVAYGSNGKREYMRDVARKAIESINKAGKCE